MRVLFLSVLLAASIAGCGDNDDPQPPAATPAPAETRSDARDGYSEGVKRYYGRPRSDAGDDVEAEYHQPPMPPEAGVGDTITLTGSNIGVRLEVTVEDVKASGEATEVRLRLENTGIAVYEAPLRNAALTYPRGRLVKADAEESCSRDFDPAYLRIDVGRRRGVCMLFPRGDGAQRLQLALENVPTEAGGIWNLG